MESDQVIKHRRTTVRHQSSLWVLDVWNLLQTSFETSSDCFPNELYLDIGHDDRLIQEKLATDLGISRTPVREALIRLEQEGVLRKSAQGGFRLYRMSDQEVRELYQTRAAIEGQVARILAERHTPQDIASLRSARPAINK